MESNLIIQVVEYIVLGLEIFGVAVIGFAFLHAMILALLRFGRKKKDVFERLKLYLGKALRLGLEFLVAADIIRTVSVKPTLESILSLGLLVLIRTFLIWSITVESEGRWPWQSKKTQSKKG